MSFIKEYLLNRVQRVNVNGEYSEWTKVKSGIPQGSILGPLFLIIFINDLSDNMSNFCKIFADDTKIIGPPGQLLQNDLQVAEEWAKKWGMKFNATKCKTLCFGEK